MFDHILRYIFNSVCDPKELIFGKRKFFEDLKVPTLNQTKPNNDS